MQMLKVAVAGTLLLLCVSCQKSPNAGGPQGQSPTPIKAVDAGAEEGHAFMLKHQTPESLKNLTPAEREKYNQEVAYGIFFSIREGEFKKQQAITSKDENLGMIPKFQPNLKSRMGESFLTEAVKAGSPNLVKEFLKKGTDPSLKNAAGKTPLDLAREMKRKDLAVLLPGEK